MPTMMIRRISFSGPRTSPAIMLTAIQPSEAHEQLREERRQRADGGGRRHEEIQPAEDEGGAVSVGGAQEDVGAARLREHRAQLRERQRAAETHEAEERPQAQERG